MIIMTMMMIMMIIMMIMIKPKAGVKEGRRSSGGREGWGGSLAPRWTLISSGSSGSGRWTLH